MIRMKPQTERDLSDRPVTDNPDRLLAASVVRPILVATDGTAQADAALRVAGEIALGDGRPVWVITVVPPLSIALPHIEAHWSTTGVGGRRDLALAQVQEQVARVTHGAPWPTVAQQGVPAQVIAGFATDIDASLIVIGMGRHGIVDRLTGAATALSLVRQATTPVLAATPWLAWPPRRVVAAVDRTGTSDDALRMAAAVVARDGMLEVVTVDGERRRDYHRVPREATRYPRIERMLAQLRQLSGRIRQRVVVGDPVTRLLESVAAESADLIVTSPRQRELLGRMLRGEVTSALLQRAPCAILAVPEGAAAILARDVRSSGIHPFDRPHATGGGQWIRRPSGT